MKKVIWITGAGSGIGEALALAYNHTEHTIILSGRNKTQLESVSKNKKEIANNSIFNLNDWNTFKKDIIKFKNVGIFINSDEKFDPSIEELESFQIIQINFQTFKDGRPFSLAKNLRKKKLIYRLT